MAGEGLGFFGGLLEGLSGSLFDQEKRKADEKHESRKAMADFLLKGYSEGDIEGKHVLPALSQIYAGTLDSVMGGKKGKGGKGGSPIAALADPDNLSALLLGIHSATSGSPASGPAGPTGLPTAGPMTKTGEMGQSAATAPETAGEGVQPVQEAMQGPVKTSIFRTREERTQQELQQAESAAGATVTGRGKAQANLSDLFLRTGRAKTREEANQMAGMKEPTAARIPSEGSAGAFINGRLADAEAQKGSTLTTAEEQQVREKATKDYAELRRPSPASQGPGTFADLLKRTEAEQGRNLTAKELVALQSDWSHAHAQESTEEKVDRAKTVAQYRASLQTVTNPQEFAADVSTTTSGRKYIDLSTYDIKSRQLARQWANQNGVTPATKEQAASLTAVDTARLNQIAMRDTILDKLPKDALGRPLGGAKNTLAQLAQTDPELAAYPAWRESAIQQVRAMQGMGSGQYRLTQQMVNIIINNDIPQLTDTVDTAIQKFAVVKKQLDDVEDSITIRNRQTLLPGGANERKTGSEQSTPLTAPVGGGVGGFVMGADGQLYSVDSAGKRTPYQAGGR